MRIPSAPQLLKKLTRLFFAFLLLKIAWFLVMHENGADLLAGRTRADIFARRDYLLERVHLESLGVANMPAYLDAQFQGEWAIVTYSMLATAVTNIAFMFPETRADSLKIVSALIERVLTPEIRRFDTQRWGEDPLESLGGSKGHIGYLGHLHWMLGTHYFLGGDARYDELFSSIAGSLYRRLQESPGLCLETYPQEIYVPDNLVVFASIANFSLLNQGKFGDLGGSWITYARRELLEPTVGLLPFLLNDDCRASGGARGSGAGWASFYLPYVDKDFAAEQFENLKAQFTQNRIVTGIREYPRNVFGVGDVDSGPVIFGFSPSATGFAVGGAAHAKDGTFLTDLLATAEVVGSSIEWRGKRRYMVGPLVGDAIMLAMKTARTWDLRYVAER